MLAKSEDILHLWRLAARTHDGTLYPGPFAKLFQLFAIIGWSVLQPPYVADHLGLVHNLQKGDKTWLLFQLRDAWYQVIAHRAQHKTMSDLHGLNVYLTKLDHHTLDQQARSRVSALQSGSFLSTAEHSRYDTSKSKNCGLCNCTDDRRHWHTCPKYATLRKIQGFRAEDFTELPNCSVFHLLSPQIPLEYTLRVWLANLHDHVQSFESLHTTDDTQHIFTDGACRKLHPAVHLASWATFNATTEQILAVAHLAGAKHTSARAEVTAILSALHWSVITDSDICIWTDALNAANTAQDLLDFPGCNLPEVDQDLWAEVQSLLTLREHKQTLIRWIPSHLEGSKLENHFEDWVCKWNGKVDALATDCNSRWHSFTLGLCNALIAQLERQESLLKRLRNFDLAIADTTQQPEVGTDPQISASSITESLVDCLTESLPISWYAQITSVRFSFSNTFATSLFSQFFEWEVEPECSVWLTDLELFFLLADCDFAFPVEADHSILRPYSCFFAKPPATRLLQPVTAVLSEVLSRLDLGVFRRAAYSKPELGLHLGLGATQCGLPRSLATRARDLMGNFLKKRPARSRQDLSRPLVFS